MDIETLQIVLKHFGYFTGKIDGTWNRNTELALRKFQKEAGLLSLGILDDRTIDKLVKLKMQWELDEALAYTE